MLCHALANIVGSSQLLLRGSFVSEPVKSNLHAWELDRIHDGKEGSINHMLAGGNGIPDNSFVTHMARAAFDVGLTRERSDLRALHFWQASLANCQADMHRRFSI